MTFVENLKHLLIVAKSLSFGSYDSPFPLPLQLIERIEARPARCPELLVWIRICLTSHLAYLSTVPMATESLGYLEDLASVRLAAHERVCKLHGKLETLLAQVRRDVTMVTIGE